MKTLRIKAQPWINGAEHGTQLYGLKFYPYQKFPIKNSEVKRLFDLLIERMKWTDTPSEQFQRIGLSRNGE